MRAFIYLVCFTCWGTHISSQADSLYSARLVLSTLDTLSRQACYDLELKNTGDNPWTLNSFLFNLYYDPSVAVLVRDSSLATVRTYSNTVRTFPFTRPGDLINSGLPYGMDSVALIRVGLNSKESGVGDTLRPSDDWAGTVRLCFEILVDDMTAPNTCLHINFHNPQIEQAFVNAGGGRLNDDFIVWKDRMASVGIAKDTTYSIIPMGTRTSCFIVDESQHGLCSDNIDNDEDGTTDCDDCDCGPGVITQTLLQPTCAQPQGGITFSGGKAGVTYSIDGGATFSEDSIFTQLDSGQYQLIVRMNDVEACQYEETVTLILPDCRESDMTTCSDGIDNDADGLIDMMDDGCCPSFVMVMSSDPMSCPDLSDGDIEILSSTEQLRYSIDSGQTYVSSRLFENLSADTFYILVMDTTTGCEVAYDQNPVILSTTIICPEICNDNQDNDKDGLIDCMDPDCMSQSICFRSPTVVVSNILSLGSQTNQYMRITADQIITVDVSVYDRWGNQVYHNPVVQSDEMTGWDGRDHNGDFVGTGVYIYHLHYTSGDSIYDKWGDITVIN